PRESVRQSARTPQRKRFYKEAGATETEGGFAITLDGKPIRTPSGRQVVIPSRALADAVAAEWAAQGETIDPVTMPLTRIANSVVEGVVDRVELVTDDLAKYFESDLLFYRAGHPEGLVAREAAHWDPLLFWAAETLGAHFILSE
ncbi:ATP12 family chaperone protein, partial [Pseudomonas fluorescens]|nr:ATP12 family chaperone protein [Pseudomonas fluorescens]